MLTLEVPQPVAAQRTTKSEVSQPVQLPEEDPTDDCDDRVQWSIEAIVKLHLILLSQLSHLAEPATPLEEKLETVAVGLHRTGVRQQAVLVCQLREAVRPLHQSALRLDDGGRCTRGNGALHPALAEGVPGPVSRVGTASHPNKPRVCLDDAELESAVHQQGGTTLCKDGRSFQCRLHSKEEPLKQASGYLLMVLGFAAYLFVMGLVGNFDGELEEVALRTDQLRSEVEPACKQRSDDRLSEFVSAECTSTTHEKCRARSLCGHRSP